MYLHKANIIQFRNFVEAELDLTPTSSQCFALASPNGGGKSTLLQFIFILLHCFKNKDKHEYIKNLFSSEKYLKETKIAEFNLEIKGEKHFLHFQALPIDYAGLDLSIFEDYENVDMHLNSLESNSEYDISELMNIKESIDLKRRIDPILQRRITSLRRYTRTGEERSLHMRSIEERDPSAALSLIERLLERAHDYREQLQDVKNIKDNLHFKLNETIKQLSDLNKSFILDLGNGFVLTAETDIPEDKQKYIEEHIYLSAPASQVFLFLGEEEKSSILNLNNDNTENTYTSSVAQAKERINGFFTYDFTTTELISRSFDKAFASDKQQKIETGSYGNNYDQLVDELNNFLEGKSISQNQSNSDIIFKVANSDITLKPEELSHGELKKLSLYSWLKHIVKPNSLILIDELDIALHPKWQEEILSDLMKWEPSNIYFAATHSPQVINSIDYRNIRLLKCTQGESKIEMLERAPLDRDVNTIISQIMGANYFPQKLLELHVKYRKMVDDDTYKSELGLNVRNEILQYESVNSEFFQDIQYDIDEKEEQ
ncbi:AAA family ATPase [Vibrio parahaemolyticus]|uniref:AAA family ATPase n=1 Tax=Vibrio parahaemolyticus TaxID=670 RepID=UPI00044D450E|nr:AAA family ATPase [Vibrio parahaemolyticus]EXJ31390.1 AAA domain protein [Vibrio parahaemolyticus VPTS-2009]